MRTTTILSAMEEASRLVNTNLPDTRTDDDWKIIKIWYRQYKKFRTRLLQRIEFLEQFHRDNARLALARAQLIEPKVTCVTVATDVISEELSGFCWVGK
jgi:hypothetical protein